MIKRKGIKKVILPIFFAFFSVLITGFFTLDISHASSFSTAIVLCFFYFSGIFWRSQKSSPQQIFFLTSAGLIFYVITAFILHSIRSFHLPPFYCFMGFCIGFWVKRIRYPGFILWVAFAFYYGFIGYPQLEMTYNKVPTTNHPKPIVTNLSQIRLLDSSRNNITAELHGRLTMLETWNMYCGACFQAMKDLHPFLKEMEQKHTSFSHYYVYTGQRMPKGDTISTVFRNSRIPFKDQRILWDPERQLLDLPNATGLPQFIFLDSALNVLHFSEGYRTSFSYGYKKSFQTIIAQNTPKILRTNPAE